MKPPSQYSEIIALQLHAVELPPWAVRQIWGTIFCSCSRLYRLGIVCSVANQLARGPRDPEMLHDATKEHPQQAHS